MPKIRVSRQTVNTHIFMPLAWKVRWGHLGIGLSVWLCYRRGHPCFTKTCLIYLGLIIYKACGQVKTSLHVREWKKKKNICTYWNCFLKKNIYPHYIAVFQVWRYVEWTVSYQQTGKVQVKSLCGPAQGKEKGTSLLLPNREGSGAALLASKDTMYR